MMDMRMNQGREPYTEERGWTGELRRLESTGRSAVPYTEQEEATPMQQQSGRMQQRMNTEPQMKNNLSDDVIQTPGSREEVYMGSLKAMLAANKGTYIVASFLVGTQNLVTWEGILYEVGNDYVTIYQQGRDRYIVGDIYSLKFMEFYDIERREACEEMLRQSGWDQQHRPWLV